MNAQTAGSIASYRIVSAGRDRRFGTRDDRATALRLAAYDAAARTVTLWPTRAASLSQPLRLIIAETAGLADEAGNRLDGNRDGRPGGDYTASITRRGATPLLIPAATASAAAVDRALELVGWLPELAPQSGLWPQNRAKARGFGSLWRS
jgi:hypothetical protein